jgi:hypothetical protein
MEPECAGEVIADIGEPFTDESREYVFVARR